jgi:hypothetical protein
VNPFNKLLLIPLVALAIGGGVGIAAATNGSAGGPANPPTVDVKGPCDELEHATDPGCSGARVPEDDQAGTTTGEANEPGDDNGRDDNDPAEVEANDAHGQGADQGENEDNQGRNDDQGENEQGDDSGPSANSGPGSSHDSGDDDSGDDDSGHGGHSGHGGGDDD